MRNGILCFGLHPLTPFLFFELSEAFLQPLNELRSSGILVAPGGATRNLENNIFGVDLDAQAVEVAQLSLYLKLLEEETTATAQQYLDGFKEQLLPDLNKNIVHGNSLIDYDIMDSQLFKSSPPYEGGGTPLWADGVVLSRSSTQ